MTWAAYGPIAAAEWTRALESTGEALLQECLERHPSLLPIVTVYDQSLLGGHHGVWMDAVISQPPLPGFHRRVPDFMWIKSDSATVVVTCVEIERQDKFWFRRDGTPTAQLTQALDQLEEWRIWFATASKDEFFETYRLPSVWRLRHFSQKYVLVYGRRSEFDTTAGSRHGAEAHYLNRKRARMMSPDTAQMTLDAIGPSESNRQLVTVRLRENRLEAVSVPPTFTCGQHMRHLARNVEGLELSIRSMATPASAERIGYLARRLEFWQAAPEFGSFRTGSE